MSFKQFMLTEAVFNVNKFKRVLELFEKVLEKRIGKIYRYGGADGVVNLKYSGGLGVGFLYLYKESSAFRINYVKTGSSFEFESIDIWLKFGLKNFEKNIKPSFRIKLPRETNIISVVDAVADVLKNPRDGVKVFISESEQIDREMDLLTEKKKVELDEFIAYAMKIKTDLTKLKYTDIKEISDQFDISIPGVIWGMKAGRGIFDLTKEPDSSSFGSGPEAKMKNSSTDILLISRGDDGKFYKMEPKTAPEKELKQVQDQIDRVIKSQEAKEMTPAHILFEDMEDLVHIVATGQRPSLMVIGGPGIGKTHTVLETVKKAGLKERSDYVIVKGKATPAALYRSLFLNHDKLVIFDDTDSVFGDSDAVNILKAALDSYDVRIVSWLSQQTVNVSTLSKSDYNEFIEDARAELVDNPESKRKLPSEFIFSGRIIFISNLPKHKLDSAVISRSLTIDMTLTEAQVLDRLESIMEHLGDPNQDMGDKIEVLNFMKDLVKSGGQSDFAAINMRTFIAALGVKASGTPNWKRLLRYV